MIVHFKRFSVGTADLIYGRLKRKGASDPIHLIGQDKAKPAGALAYSLLVLVAFLLVAALVLPSLVPAASSVLAPFGAQGLVLLVGGVCLGLFARFFYRLGQGAARFYSEAYQRGLEIEMGLRTPAWAASES